METPNPYTSPQANLFGSSSSSGGAITPGVILQLQKTKPWVRFFSVMMFLGAAFMVLAALVMGVMGAAFGSAALEGKGSPAMQAGFGAGMAAIYGVMAVLYIYPGIKLWKYADRIRDLQNSADAAMLEAALNEQRAFWKYVGVMIIVMICLYAVAIVVMGVVVGVAAAKSGGIPH